MTIRIVQKGAQKTKNWSGGTTTELFIYPPDASYERREFLFRISTALCTQAESTFTNLPGTRRILMPLDGNLRLLHAGRPPVDLEPGMCDVFSGEETTRSYGSCRDFNLMLRGAAQGSICYKRLRAGEHMLPCASAFTGLYLWKGEAVLKDTAAASRPLPMQAGDFALLSYGADAADHYNSSCSVCITAEMDAVLAAAYVWGI